MWAYIMRNAPELKNPSTTSMLYVFGLWIGANSQLSCRARSANRPMPAPRCYSQRAIRSISSLSVLGKAGETG